MTPEEKLDELFQGLWDRVKRSVELINELRSRNASMQETISRLEADVSRLEKDLTEEKKKTLSLEREVGILKEEAASDDGGKLSNGEMEELAEKARDLLGRIEGYL